MQFKVGDTLIVCRGGFEPGGSNHGEVVGSFVSLSSIHESSVSNETRYQTKIYWYYAHELAYPCAAILALYGLERSAC
jgi:hypothetical protein